MLHSNHSAAQHLDILLLIINEWKCISYKNLILIVTYFFGEHLDILTLSQILLYTNVKNAFSKSMGDLICATLKSISLR